jgi:hypothetical protein
VTAKAKFRTIGPNIQSPKVTLGTPQVIRVAANDDRLSFGNIVTAKAPGMRVDVRSTASPKPGTFSWTQVVDADSFVFLNGGVRTVCSFGTGLDNIYPYDTGTTTNDSPGTGLDAAWSRASQSNTFRMFLMWQSSMAGSIPVPLGFATWKWSATAVQNMATHIWNLTAKSKSFTAAAGDTFPLWNKVLVNGPRPCK